MATIRAIRVFAISRHLSAPRSRDRTADDVAAYYPYIIMLEYRPSVRSFGATTIPVLVAVRDERSTVMYDGLYEAITAEHKRQAAWADEHAWKYEQMRTARRSYRARVAHLLRALAERIAPM